MFAGSSDTDLHALTSDSLCTVFSVNVESPEICVGTSDVDLNGWIFTWSINTPLFTSNRYGLIFTVDSLRAEQLPSNQSTPLLPPLLESSIPLGFE